MSVLDFVNNLKKVESKFSDKQKVLSNSFLDVHQEEHAVAFMVACANRDDVLTDLFKNVSEAVDGGKPYEQFKAEFDRMVKETNWSFGKMSVDQKARIVFDTNLFVAKSVAQYKKLTGPINRRVYPYWQYHHDNSVNDPRPEHVALDGLVLDANDPFWQKHWPPNGYNCHCYVTGENRITLAIKGKKVGKAPTIDTYSVTIDGKKIDDKDIPEGQTDLQFRSRYIPKTNGEGWAYNPGEASQGRPVADKTITDYSISGQWLDVTSRPSDHQDIKQSPYERPEPRADSLKLSLLGDRASRDDAKKALSHAIGGAVKAIMSKGDHPNPVVVNAESVAKLLDKKLLKYVTAIPQLIENPAESWLAFEKNKATGKVVLRQYFIAKYGDDILVAQANRGVFEALSVIKKDQLPEYRRGRLLFDRTDKGTTSVDERAAKDKQLISEAYNKTLLSFGFDPNKPITKEQEKRIYLPFKLKLQELRDKTSQIKPKKKLFGLW